MSQRRTVTKQQPHLPQIPPRMRKYPRIREKVLKAQPALNSPFFPIPYPIKKSEFEIQAELYNLLKSEGYNVRGEVLADFREMGYQGRNRLDLVIYSVFNIPHLIIECKNDMKDGFEIKPGTRQHRRYNLHGVKVLKHSGANTAELLKLIKEEVEKIELE